MGRKISPAAGSRAQNPSILPPKGGTTNSEKRAARSPKNFPTNKIFLPKIPRLGADGFHPSNSHRPARPGPAQPSSQLIKQPIEGRKISWAGHDHAPTSDPAKKWAVKDGDFCSRHFFAPCPLCGLCGLGSVPSVKCMGSSGLGSLPSRRQADQNASNLPPHTHVL